MQGCQVQGDVVGVVFHMDQVHLGVIAQVGSAVGGHTGHVQAVPVIHLGQGGGAGHHLGLAQCHAAAGIAQVDAREFGIAAQPGEIGLHIGRRVQHIDAHHLAVAGQGLRGAGPGFAYLQALGAISADKLWQCSLKNQLFKVESVA